MDDLVEDADEADEYLPATPSPDFCALAWMGLLQPGMAVVDVGCGFGQDMRYAAEFGCRAHGIDASPVSIQYARAIAPEKNTPQFELVKDAAEWLEARPATFDLVSDRLCLSNTPTWREERRLIQAVAHALKPGGIYVVRFGYDPDESLSGRPLRRKDVFSASVAKIVDELFAPLEWHRTVAGRRVTHVAPIIVSPMLPVVGEWATLAACTVLVKRSAVAGRTVPNERRQSARSV